MLGKLERIGVVTRVRRDVGYPLAGGTVSTDTPATAKRYLTGILAPSERAGDPGEEVLRGGGLVQQVDLDRQLGLAGLSVARHIEHARPIDARLELAGELKAAQAAGHHHVG